jgi:hypothetical protein
MPTSRLSLFHYDVVRELCAECAKEKFHFVPTGAAPEPGHCSRCGAETSLADLSETSIIRLVTQPNGEVVVVPVIR